MMKTDMMHVVSRVYYDQDPTEGRRLMQEMFQDVTILDKHVSWERLIDDFGRDYLVPCIVASIIS